MLLRMALALVAGGATCAFAYEWMPVPTSGTQAAADCGEATGPARVWDFSDGKIPEGCQRMPLATLSADGLGCSDLMAVDKAGGVLLQKRYTPDGAFLFEADLTLGNHGKETARAYEGRVWDDMGIDYVPKCDNTGLEVSLVQEPNGYWKPLVRFGLGKGTAVVEGPRKRFYRGAQTKLAFYFGANRTVCVEFGGQTVERVLPYDGSLVPSKRFRPAIGSRPISNHAHFDGFVRRVAITPMRVDGCVFRLPNRVAFLRGEENARLAVAIDNRTSSSVDDASVTFEQFARDGKVYVTEKKVGMIPSGASLSLALDIETHVRPGWHVVRAALNGRLSSGERMRHFRLLRYGIGPRTGDCMRTVMWGYSSAESALADFGFTHGYAYKGVSGPITEDFDRKPIMDLFDRALVSGVGIIRIVGPRYYPEGEEPAKYQRRTRNGLLTKFPQPEVGQPALVERFRDICRADADIFGDHPAFQGVLPYSERRDRAFPSFNTEHLRYRAETGCDVPPEIDGRTFGVVQARKRFPDGIVQENDPVYRYYRWYWRGGDGWRNFLSAGITEFRKRIGRPDFQSVWDPAVRAAPTWGSGGGADMLNQWCYAVPEPMNVAGPCEEVLAMTEGTPGQKAAIMTQLICYRSQMAPTNVTVANMPEWARRFPKLAFPTIPPDVLQEATWSMLAKPVSAIMFHGWETVYDCRETSYYGYTNPDSADLLRRLLKDVVAPLGPMLKRLGRETPRVAVLESFTTCAMGGPASWGWKVPAVTMLQRARLDPRVIYEDSILNGGLSGVDVLFAPQCCFLPSAVIGKVREFQARGGTLVADSELVSALKADVTVPVVSFEAPPESDHVEDVEALEAGKSAQMKTRLATVRAKRHMQDVAEEVRNALRRRGFMPMADSSSPEIVVYSREWKGVSYLFAVNDKRTFGDYVGQWGLVMEHGVPIEGSVSLNRTEKGIGAVYELSKGGKVDFVRRDNAVDVAVRYSTNDGRLFVFLPSEIAAIDVETPRSVSRGGRLAVTMTVRDAKGRPIPALLPVDVRLYDSSGREIDGGGFACAVDGVATAVFVTNVDDPKGNYRLVCSDRASGLKSEFVVEQE